MTKTQKTKNKKSATNQDRREKSSTDMRHRRKDYHSSHYFNQETEKMLLKYIKETDLEKKEMIYKQYVHVPLSKLVENIIHTFKFKSFYDDYEDLKQEVLSFLITRLDKFDKKVSKAYTFLSIIAKRYLILNSQMNYKKMRLKEDVEMVDFDKNILNEECARVLKSDDVADYYEFFTSYLEENKRSFCKNENDEKIMNSLIRILKSKEERTDIDNRKRLYKKIKEEVKNVSNSMITKVINLIKNRNPEIRKNYCEQEKKSF